jgi:hypothetical protein
MNVASEIQLKLVELASLDQNIKNGEYKKKSHPQLIKITELTLNLPNIEALIVENDSLINETKKELAKAEIDVEHIAKRIENDTQRLNSSATSAKDLVQLDHEIGTLKAKISGLEEVELSVLEKIEDYEFKKKGLEELKNKVKQDIHELDQAIKADFKIFDKDIKESQESKKELVKTFSEEIYNLYEKLRIEHGVGATLLSNGKCSSCQIQISPAELETIKNTNLNEVIRCENCRCILVRK